LFFLAFWRRSHDRFFALFASAFLMLGGSWLVLVLAGSSSEINRPFYLARLLAFLLIILAVIEKNRSN